MLAEEWRLAREQFDDFFPTAIETFSEEFQDI